MNNPSTTLAILIIIGGLLFLPKAGLADSESSFSESYRQTSQEFNSAYKDAGTGPGPIVTKDPKSPAQSRPEARSPAQDDQPSQLETVDPTRTDNSLLVPEDRKNIIDPSAD